MIANQRAAQLAQALADPLRLTMLRHLMGGESTVAELTSIAGTSQSNVSNHLAVLRAQNLVSNRRDGRQSVYRIADPTAAQLVESLTVLAGAPVQLTAPIAPLAAARTCYDHLAGALGVAVFDALVVAEAITPPDHEGPANLGPSGEVTLGPNAEHVFGRLGVDIASASATRRQFAYACRDWTERRFHLGGALGAEIYRRFVEARWVAPGEERRQLSVTESGRAALKTHLGLDLPSAVSSN
ncbi:MAG: metalloregulator ArsR/SmtB family transcription factor [Nitrolancea sp.]